MVPALSIAPRLSADRSGWGEHSPVSHAPLSVIVVCLTFVLSNIGSCWAGRMVEQRTQLGYLIASAPALSEMQAATRSADSLAMRFMLQMERMKRRRVARFERAQSFRPGSYQK